MEEGEEIMEDKDWRITGTAFDEKMINLSKNRGYRIIVLIVIGSLFIQWKIMNKLGYPDPIDNVYVRIFLVLFAILLLVPFAFRKIYGFDEKLRDRKKQ